MAPFFWGFIQKSLPEKTMTHGRRPQGCTILVAHSRGGLCLLGLGGWSLPCLGGGASSLDEEISGDDEMHVPKFHAKL